MIRCHSALPNKRTFKAGIIPSTLYDILKRKSGCPRIQTVKLLCDAIGITLSEFFDVDYINSAEYEDER